MNNQSKSNQNWLITHQLLFMVKLNFIFLFGSNVHNKMNKILLTSVLSSVNSSMRCYSVEKKDEKITINGIYDKNLKLK